MENSLSYIHKAQQRKIPNQRSEEDSLFIRLKSYECSIWRREIGGPIKSYFENTIARRLFKVKFSHFKQQLSDNDSNYYERLISVELKKMQVPEDEHPSIVETIFRVVEAAVSPENPVVVQVWAATQRIGPYSIPASRSSIQGLEPVTVVDADTSSSSCAVCLEDVEQEPFTRLPCTHHFHVHCIVRCLEINHLCPLCRYAMPTEED